MTARLKIKGDRYYAVINYKEGTDHKQKWIALGIPAKNNKRRAEAMLDEIKREYEERYSTPAGDMMFVAYARQWLEKRRLALRCQRGKGIKST